MIPKRVAVIFDKDIRPDTTGIYCLKALQALTNVQHLRPQDLPHVPSNRFDLFLRIDDGLDYELPSRLRPRAWWIIDSHLSLPWYLQQVSSYEFVFAAQRNAVQSLQGCCNSEVRWLPLACDPAVHRKHDLAKTHDIVFVGNVFPGVRSEVLDCVKRHYPQFRTVRAFFDDMAREYSCARISINRSIRDDVNMRVFEAVSCGTLLLTNDLAENGQSELLQDGVHLATYRSLDELVDKIEFYLRRPDVRERIAAQGCEYVTSQHTYHHRMTTVLQAYQHKRHRGQPANEAEDPEDANAIPPSPALESSVTSIIILTHNQLDYTKLCLASIRHHTSVPTEIIVVDNGSTDGTVEWLGSQADVTTVLNATNLGFAVGCNQGIQRANGRRVLLLNNDVIVAPFWLENLVAALDSSPDVGLVGPTSNQVSGKQQICVSYTDLALIPAFAEQVIHENKGRYEETDRLVGFCMLIRREVLDQIGLLDELFEVGMFEDDDLCRRARRAGWKCLIARDAFVHHFGGVTFQSLDRDVRDIFEKNRARFDEKWQDIDASNVDETLALSLCMIVRDSARHLDACLRRAAPWVDEIVVVDMGSTDETREIAQRHGARVFDLPWQNCFATARNESIRHARGEWILWMDADETLPAENGRQLRVLLSQPHPPDCLGFAMQVHSTAGSDAKFDVVNANHVKVFRNHPELRFEGHIHEQILPSIDRMNGEVVETELFVVHSDSDQSQDERHRKWEREFRLLDQGLGSRPNRPLAFFHSGMMLADMGQHEHAIQSFEHALAVATPEESHVRKLFALLIGSLVAIKRHEEARRYLKQANAMFPDDPELLFQSAVFAHHAGELLGAERTYLKLLSTELMPDFNSMDQGILSYKALHNLAIVYSEMEKLADTDERCLTVVDTRENFTSRWRCHGETLIAKNCLKAAESLCWHLDATDRPGEATLLRAHVAAARGDHATAARLYSRASSELHPDIGPLQFYCKHAFEHGELHEACVALEQLRTQHPTDPAAHHNLGIVYLRMNQHHQARESFQESLRLRPNHPETTKLLQAVDDAVNEPG